MPGPASPSPLTRRISVLWPHGVSQNFYSVSSRSFKSWRMRAEFISGVNLNVALRGAVSLLQGSVILYIDSVSMGFVDSDSIAEIKEFVGFSEDNATVSLVLRTLFLYGFFTSLFRFIFPKKFEFDNKPSEKALTMADNSAEEASEKTLALAMADNSAEEASEKAVGREELRRVFSIFDKNGDGLISKEEMKDSLDKLRLCVGEEELASTIRTVDVNGDGYVDFDEFVTLYESMSGKHGEEKEEAKTDDEDADLSEAFGVFDDNGDGLITVEELQSVLKSLGLKEGRTIGDCKKMIQKVDKDGDGMVNYLEFKEMMGAGFGRNN